MKKGFGKPKIELMSEDFHFTLELETKEQCDFCIDQIKIIRKTMDS